MKRRYLSYIGALILSAVCPAAAESAPNETEPAAVPPPRTITAELEPERAKRIAELEYNDAEMRVCVDSWQLQASRKEIHPGDSVTFRIKSARKCDGRTLPAPKAVTASMTVRSTQGRRAASDSAQTIHPESSSYSFTHVFESAGAYQVAVRNRVDAVEVHTVSFIVSVTEPEVHAVQPQITE